MVGIGRRFNEESETQIEKKTNKQNTLLFVFVNIIKQNCGLSGIEAWNYWKQIK